MIDATVAQSVEQFTRNEQVAGSNPAGSSNFIMNIRRCVGTGRRDGLKIRCQRWRVGSSPTTGTINKEQATACSLFIYVSSGTRTLRVQYLSASSGRNSENVALQWSKISKSKR